ncbi:uncharacterized protein LOC115638738 [Gopherus evgoodei]|uniref:uncharacterized protein LOC115638738 n=1 Tax=Gopherus evgoodei TaxID=1825980 RepID=UPI0011CFE24A|nr:uncharacterized protein LOC115638738 [Gopherus evgoodei]
MAGAGASPAQGHLLGMGSGVPGGASPIPQLLLGMGQGLLGRGALGASQLALGTGPISPLTNALLGARSDAPICSRPWASPCWKSLPRGTGNRLSCRVDSALERRQNGISRALQFTRYIPGNWLGGISYLSLGGESKAPWQSGIHQMSAGGWSLPRNSPFCRGACPRMALSAAAAMLGVAYPGALLALQPLVPWLVSRLLQARAKESEAAGQQHEELSPRVDKEQHPPATWGVTEHGPEGRRRPEAIHSSPLLADSPTRERRRQRERFSTAQPHGWLFIPDGPRSQHPRKTCPRGFVPRGKERTPASH